MTQDNIWGPGPEPIAVIGVGCRFPGESFSPSKLWDLLKNGRSAQSDFPKNRFNVDTWYHPDSNRPGSVSTRGGYFLSHDDAFQQFDPSFFGISPLEAATMDPQQRKLLEVVYESFESAGATLEDISGSKTSCYVGCFTHDVANMNAREAEYGVPYEMTGSDMTILSNRVNYVFNLKGPSLTLDTACSSSMVALHAACQSLISGDSDAAVVGGTNIILGVEQQIASVRLGILSPTSTCHTFDASADGFGRGDGICAIYLKKLSTALADQDNIRGVIRSTAINANGKGQGINHPSTDDQESVIRAAYRRAGLNVDDTGYFECHGTGTKVGDPIEVDAIAKVFASSRTLDNPLLLGSVKTNIGHTEGASGLAGLIKTVLSIENNLIPATVGITTLNPAIDLRDGRLKVVTSASPWPKKTLKRASINSFGYGGANAHCIIESPDVLLGHGSKTNGHQGPTHGFLPNGPVNGNHEPSYTRQADKKYLLLLSAHDRPTLDRNIAALAATGDRYTSSELAHTLAYRRTKHRTRAYTTVTGQDIGSQIFQNVIHGGEKRSQAPALAFAFTGQGAQWPRMGYSLIQQYPIVLQTIQALQTSLDKLSMPPDWQLLEELSRPAEDSRVQEAALSQPLCTAVQIALTVLLKSWGIHPKAVVGHSMGEVAAAFACGLLQAEEAIALAYYRGVAVAARHMPGAMMAVGLGASEVLPYTDSQSNIVIACHNSPKSVTLSGSDTAIDAVHKALLQDGIFARKLNTSHNAYHSHLVKEAGQYYQECVETSLPDLMHAARTSDIPMYSCVTGEALQGQHDVGIHYWRKNLENPVLFTQALSNLVSSQPEVNCLIEIGPHSALAGPIRQISESLDRTDEDLNYLPTIIRGENNVNNMLKLAGSLFVAGYPLNAKEVNLDGAPEGTFISDLVPYQWNYEQETPWTENRLSRQLRYRQHPRHDLLGSRQLGTSAFCPEWRNRLWLKNVPWISDHLVGEDIIFPASGYLAMAIEAVTQVAESEMMTVKGYTFQRLVIKAPLILPVEGEVETLFNLRAHNDTSAVQGKRWFDFNVSSVTGEDKWTEHAVGMIALEDRCEAKPSIDMEIKGHRGAENRDSSDRRWYSALANIGFHYGPTFRPLKDIHTTRETDDAMSRLALHSTSGTMIQESRYMVHPAALDGCLQLVVIAAHNGESKELTKAYLPTIIDRLCVWQTPASKPLPVEGILKSHGVRRGLRSAHGSSALYTSDGQQIAEVAVSLYSLEGGFGTQTFDTPRQPYTRLIWQPDVDRLYGNKIREIYPSGESDPLWSTLLDHLNELGELLVMEIYQSLPTLGSLDDQPSHIQKYAGYLSQEGKRLSDQRKFSHLSSAVREQRIQYLVSACGNQVPEADLMVHMSTKMSEILRGEVGALDVMLQGGLLNRMYEHGFSNLAVYPQLKNVVGLMAHKEPRLKILEVGGGTGAATKPMLEALHASSLLPRYAKYTFTDITNDYVEAAKEKFKDFPNMDFGLLDIEQDPLTQGFKAGTFDVIFASNVIHATKIIQETLVRCRTLLKPDGRIVIIETTKDRVPSSYIMGPLVEFWQGEADGRVETPFLSKELWNDRLVAAGFSGAEIILDDYAGHNSSNSIMVSHVKQEMEDLPPNTPKLWLVYRDCAHPLVKEVESQVKEQGLETEIILLTDVHHKVAKGSHIIMMAELEGPLLAEMTRREMDAVKAVFNTAASAVWITNGGLIEGKSPKHSLVFGIAKSIMIEQPTIRISSVDVDPDETNHARSAKLIVQHEIALRTDIDRVLDTELIEHDGIVYISRYTVDPTENQAFTRQLMPSPETLPMKDNLELAFRQVGQVDSFYFKEKALMPTILQDTEVLVLPEIYSIGKREAAIMKGTQDAEHFSNISSGIVKQVGAMVTNVKEGDRVICLSPGKLESSFVTIGADCEVLRPLDDAEGMTLSLLPYCTALHALNNVAFAMPRHTILIHEVTEAKHLAAVHLAHLLGSKTVITFKSEALQTIFHRKYPILNTCISCLISSGLDEHLRALTGGKGIDVALAASSSPNLPEIWSALAKNGRLVCLGESETPNLALLDPSVFLRGASLMASNIVDLLNSRSLDMANLMRRVLALLRDGSLPLIGTEAVYDVAQLPDAVDAASNVEAMANLALTYGRQSLVPIHLTYIQVDFPPWASYLLIGCLGGLGRSLVSWMLTRGARNFIFLSRSGADKPEASRLVKELEAMGTENNEKITITIVKGDVARRADVDRAIALAKTPIRGVMQQAMFLKNELFDDLSLESWQGVLDPKVQGSINLHDALINEPLDFFVMTSSVLGAIGASTQSNYAAANAFLDHMARHRLSLGLQACSIALGMIVEVGHVEAHPEVEEALRRNGVYGIPEDEYLKMMEVACRRRDPNRISWDWDNGAQSHIVTGVEPGKVTTAGGKSLWLQDNRVRNLLPAIIGMESQTMASRASASKTTETLLEAAEANGDIGVKDCVRTLALERFSKLVLVPTEKLSSSLTHPLAEFGMDSMITAELRSWAWRELKAEIPFMTLLEGDTTINGFVNILWDKMDHAIWKS